MSMLKIALRLLAVTVLVIAPAAPAVAAPDTAASGTVIATSGPSVPVLGSPYRGTMGDLDGFCEMDGELCVSYTSQMFGGSIADFAVGDCNLFDNVFLSSGTGQGQVVAGNIRALINFHGSLHAQLWTGVGCTGNYALVPPGNAGPGGTQYVAFTWVWLPVCC